MQALFEVLAVAHQRLGEPDLALRFADRAPRTPRVQAARARALLALGRGDEARSAIDAVALAKLPEDERRDLERQLA